jgi:hypothetical protein
MTKRSSGLALAVAAFLLTALPLPLLAFDGAERFQTGHDIQVESNEQTGDVTCLDCSIYVHGSVRGDVTAIDGSVILEDGAVVTGDTTAIFGDVRLDSLADAKKDVTAIVGAVRRNPHASIKGDVTELNGGGWILLVVGLPLVVLGGTLALFGWLILWLIRRVNRPAPLAA